MISYFGERNEINEYEKNKNDLTVLKLTNKITNY